MTGLFLCYIPMHDVAPRAVTIAVATDAIICTMKLLIGQSKSNSANYSAFL